MIITAEVGFTWMGGREVPVVEKSVAISKGRGLGIRRGPCAGFTLIELLIVLAITSVVTAVVLPVFCSARRKAALVKCMWNQRIITYAVNLYATDNDGLYPPSVATIGFAGQWHWEDPRLVTGYDLRRDPGLYRAMSEYLRDYIADASIMFCQNAPRKYEYWQQAWDAGDDWHHPETPQPDPVYGTYCFYWSYIGFMPEPDGPFRGPQGLSYRRRRSKVLVTDYFGYDHWRSRSNYGSSERFKGAHITEGTLASSAYWSFPNSDGSLGPEALQIPLHAGYQDGHVEDYWTSEVVPMWVSSTPDGSVPDLGAPGIFYLPVDGLH